MPTRSLGWWEEFRSAKRKIVRTQHMSNATTASRMKHGVQLQWNRPVQLHVITAKGTTRRVKGELDLGDFGFEVITDKILLAGWKWQAILVLPANPKHEPTAEEFDKQWRDSVVQELNSTRSAKGRSK